jgi:hypothetical protein
MADRRDQHCDGRWILWLHPMRVEDDLAIAQGYHISRPLPADKLVEYIRTTEMSLGNKNQPDPSHE